MHSPLHRGGGGGVGDGGLVLNTFEPGCGQHLIWLAPEHRPVLIVRPLQLYAFVLMHSPAQRGEGGDGGGVDGLDGGGVGDDLVVLRPPEGQHWILFPLGQSPDCVLWPEHVKLFVSMHSPLHRGGGGGDGAVCAGQHLTRVCVYLVAVRKGTCEGH